MEGYFFQIRYEPYRDLDLYLPRMNAVMNPGRIIPLRFFEDVYDDIFPTPRPLDPRNEPKENMQD